MAEKTKSHVENITLEQVPESEKKSWLSIAFIWAGNVICVPALMVGAMVSAGLNFKDSILAMFIGYGITVALMMLIAAQSAQTGRPSMVAVSRALGERGFSVYYFSDYSDFYDWLVRLSDYRMRNIFLFPDEVRIRYFFSGMGSLSSLGNTDADYSILWYRTDKNSECSQRSSVVCLSDLRRFSGSR